MWHSIMRKITDKVRADGKVANPAPVQFFIFHTSGDASWWGITMLIFAVVDTFFPGRRLLASTLVVDFRVDPQRRAAV
jgi:hypothetical protein